MSFFLISLLSFRMRFWNYCLEQSLHLPFANLLVPAFPFIAERVGGKGAERTLCRSAWNFFISLSSQFVYLYFHLLPTSLKIFEVIGPLKLLCLFSFCQIKARLPEIYSQPWRFPTLGTCAERASEGPLGNNSAV